MKKTLAALAGALVALPVLAAGPQGFAAAPQAQGPKGFDTEPATTVAAVLESGKDHQIVTLRGKFTEHVRGDNHEGRARRNPRRGGQGLDRNRTRRPLRKAALTLSAAMNDNARGPSGLRAFCQSRRNPA